MLIAIDRLPYFRVRNVQCTLGTSGMSLSYTLSINSVNFLMLIYLIVCLTSFENLLTNILREISVNVFVLFCCFQGGNTAFIFLGNSPSCIPRESGCKVVFYEPKQRLAASEVTAAVKNPFTLKVTVPHCPSKLS